LFFLKGVTHAERCSEDQSTRGPAATSNNEAERKLLEGQKLTAFSGQKGVISLLEEPHNLPCCQEGYVAGGTLGSGAGP